MLSLPLLASLNLRFCNMVTAAGVQALRSTNAAPTVHIKSRHGYLLVLYWTPSPHCAVLVLRPPADPFTAPLALPVSIAIASHIPVEPAHVRVPWN